jgi:hypothetical protein
MIFVKKNREDSSQKVVSMFLKRVKKSNLIARKRKTKHAEKPLSHLEKKRKAMRIANYAENQTVLDRISKK